MAVGLVLELAPELAPELELERELALELVADTDSQSERELAPITASGCGPTVSVPASTAPSALRAPVATDALSSILDTSSDRNHEERRSFRW